MNEETFKPSNILWDLDSVLVEYGLSFSTVEVDLFTVDSQGNTDEATLLASSAKERAEEALTLITSDEANPIIAVTKTRGLPDPSYLFYYEISLANGDIYRLSVSE